MKLAILIAVLRVLGTKHDGQAMRVTDAIFLESLAASVSVDPLLVAAIVEQESSFNPKAENFDGKCIGLMQPRMGVSTKLSKRRLQDPATNVREGIRILQEKIKQCGTLPSALEAYNQGSCSPKGKAGRVARRFAKEVILKYGRNKHDSEVINTPPKYPKDVVATEA